MSEGPLPSSFLLLLPPKLSSELHMTKTPLDLPPFFPFPVAFICTFPFWEVARKGFFPPFPFSSFPLGVKKLPPAPPPLPLPFLFWFVLKALFSHTPVAMEVGVVVAVVVGLLPLLLGLTSYSRVGPGFPPPFLPGLPNLLPPSLPGNQ